MNREEDRQKRRLGRHRNLVAKHAPQFNKSKRYDLKIDLSRQKYKKLDLEDW